MAIQYLYLFLVMLWYAGNPYPWDTGDRKTDQYRLLMCFMSKVLAAANDASSATSENEAVTAPCYTLEEAIDLLEPIRDRFSRVLERDDLKDVQFQLRCHAVLAPLRRNDRITAKVRSS